MAASTLEMTELAVAEPTGELCILDESGDSRVQWDRNNPEQVAAAKKKFDELRAKGYLLYKVDSRGKQSGEVITQFDPTAERIIGHARMIGG